MYTILTSNFTFFFGGYASFFAGGWAFGGCCQNLNMPYGSYGLTT
jgi:hypothetical protein